MHLPLAKADPHNLAFQVDILSIDFEFARLLVLKGRYGDAERGIAKVIAAFQALNSEDDSGPGMGVLWAWLGEAQFGAARFDEALKWFKRSVEELEKDPRYLWRKPVRRNLLLAGAPHKPGKIVLQVR
jgi:tetratricopeptide (TPR) repeat protein